METVLLVGRPNVGKSSLFNRITRRRQAIVTEIPGTTRDILCAEVTWQGRSFRLCDSGGLWGGDDPLQKEVEARVEALLGEAAVILFVVDAKEGLSPLDEGVAEKLRPYAEKVLLVVNKVDDPSRREVVFEFYRLGLGDPQPVSAAHGRGVADLLDMVVERLGGAKGDEGEREAPLRLTLLGRPNVGKSSLANALLGEDRQIVSPIPGTTRDAVGWPLEVEGTAFWLVDTAGLRRPGRVKPGIEFFSVRRAEEALRLSHLALLVLDGKEGVVALDQRIGGLIQKAQKGVILVINKVDGLRPEEVKRREEEVRAAFYFLPFAPVVSVSALTGKGLSRLRRAVLEVARSLDFILSTPEINRLLQEIQNKGGFPSVHGRSFRIYYGVQKGTRPPTFTLFVNDPELFHFSIQRHLENQWRQRHPLPGAPIVWEVRPRS